MDLLDNGGSQAIVETRKNSMAVSQVPMSRQAKITATAGRTRGWPVRTVLVCT